MTESAKENFIRVFPDALLLAIIMGGGYWLAFCYEAGYLDYFGISADLAEVSLQRALAVALALSGVAWLVFLVANLVVTFVN